MSPKNERICDICETARTFVHKHGGTGKFICRVCYRKYHQPKHTCTMCGNKCFSTKKNGNEYLCNICYQRHIYEAKKEVCSMCGSLRTVSLRIFDKKPLCQKCHKRYFIPREKCYRCERYKTVHARDNGRPMCDTCYNKQHKENRASALKSHLAFNY